jgi:hypothetical protein
MSHSCGKSGTAPGTAGRYPPSPRSSVIEGPSELKSRTTAGPAGRYPRENTNRDTHSRRHRDPIDLENPGYCPEGAGRSLRSGPGSGLRPGPNTGFTLWHMKKLMLLLVGVTLLGVTLWGGMASIQTHRRLPSSRQTATKRILQTLPKCSDCGGSGTYVGSGHGNRVHLCTCTWKCLKAKDANGKSLYKNLSTEHIVSASVSGAIQRSPLPLQVQIEVPPLPKEESIVYLEDHTGKPDPESNISDHTGLLTEPFPGCCGICCPKDHKQIRMGNDGPGCCQKDNCCGEDGLVRGVACNCLLCLLCGRCCNSCSKRDLDDWHDMPMESCQGLANKAREDIGTTSEKSNIRSTGAQIGLSDSELTIDLSQASDSCKRRCKEALQDKQESFIPVLFCCMKPTHYVSKDTGIYNKPWKIPLDDLVYLRSCRESTQKEPCCTSDARGDCDKLIETACVTGICLGVGKAVVACNNAKKHVLVFTLPDSVTNDDLYAECKNKDITLTLTEKCALCRGENDFFEKLRELAEDDQIPRKDHCTLGGCAGNCLGCPVVDGMEVAFEIIAEVACIAIG